MRISILIILNLLFLVSYSQDTIKIQGVVTFENKPLSGASVTLKSEGSNKLKIVQTDSSGFFNINFVSSTKDISVIANSIQYGSLSRKYASDSDSIMIFNFQNEKIIEIDTILIANRQHIQYTADKIKFNVEEMAVLKDHSLLESISKLPGILVLPNGIIYYNGKPLIFFLNGEVINVTGENLKSFLNGYPANMIKTIEIIENPGAKYKSTSNGSILNIITKSNNQLDAISGNIYIQNGLNNYLKSTSSAQIFYKKKYFSISSNISYNNNKISDSTMYYYEIPDDNNFVNEGYSNLSLNDNLFIRNNFQVNVSKRSNFNFNYLYSNNTNNRESNGVSQSELSNNIISSQNYSKTSGHSLQAVYNHNLDTTGTQIYFSATYNTQNLNNKNEMKIDNNYSSNIIINTIESDLNLRGDLEKSFNKLDLAVGAFLETKKFDNDGNFFHASHHMYNPYSFKYSNSGTYISLSKTSKKLVLSSGLRLENIQYKGSSINSYISSIDYKTFKLFPTLNLRYFLLPNISLKLSYSKKMELPSFYNANPNIISQNNALIYNMGSSSFGPEINHNIGFNINAFNYFVVNAFHNIVPYQNIQLYKAEDNNIILSQHLLKNTSRSGMNIGIPIPYSFMNRNFKNILQNSNSLNINNISFTYLNLGWNHYNFNDELDIDLKKNSYFFNTFTQVYLKNNLRLYLSYYLFFKGAWNTYYLKEKSHNFDLYMNKKIMNNKISINIGAYNLFNTAGYNISSHGKGTNVEMKNINENRFYRLSISYSFGSFKDNSQVIPNGESLSPTKR